jgi:hypothetical protein
MYQKYITTQYSRLHNNNTKRESDGGTYIVVFNWEKNKAVWVLLEEWLLDMQSLLLGNFMIRLADALDNRRGIKLINLAGVVGD